MKNILVIGAGSDVAIEFAKNYHDIFNIYGVSRNKQLLNIKDNYYVKDYSATECNQAVNWFLNMSLDLDILIIANGFGKSGKIGTIPLPKIESMMNANLLVPYYFLHHTASIFQRQKFGHVIVIGSVAGIKYAPNFAMYSATKFALRALLEAFRNEIQIYNVKTTNLQPGFVATKFWDEFGPNDNKFKYEKDISINVEEVANVIKYIIDSANETNHVVNEITCRSVYQER